jgi:cobalt/nickel transport protein
LHRFLKLIVTTFALVVGSSDAGAHFQMVYVDRSLRAPGVPLDILLLFTHPASGGPMMAMEPPQSFFMIRQRGGDKPERIDLMPRLVGIGFAAEGKAAVPAYRASVPATQIRSLGDYVIVVEPEPHYEASEDKYIQQITKTIVNVGGVPSIWDKDVGLPAEIRPLGKPYANWRGGIFRGVVLSRGRPVPNAEIEVEYLNRRPDVTAGTWAAGEHVRIPNPALAGLSIRADANGAFAIGLPRAGWWGIAALGAGPVRTHKGKPLSQDAVLWVEATDVD